jgi:hypothetical protein
MAFTFITTYGVLLLHHQPDPISKKKTKELNIQFQRKPTLPKNQKVIKPRTPRGFFFYTPACFYPNFFNRFHGHMAGLNQYSIL